MEDLEEFDRKKKMVENDLKDLRFPEGVDNFYAVIVPDSCVIEIKDDTFDISDDPIILEYKKIDGKWIFINYK